jgi:hypothetical protein
MSLKYYFTAEDLVKSVKRRMSMPNSENLFTDQEILDFANEEMALELVPLIMRKHQDYYLVRETIQIDPTYQNNKYPIPYRAIGSVIRELAYLPSLTNPNDLREMRRVSPDDLSNTSNRTSTSRHFYIENENIVLWGRNEALTSGYLVAFFWLRPNELVFGDRIATIQAIDTTTGIITVNNIPSHFAENTKFDFIRTKSPHKIYSYDIPVTAMDSNAKTIQIDPANFQPYNGMGANMAQLEVGDRIAIAGETDLVNSPSELHVLLAQMVAARVLDAIGDKENLANANDKMLRMESNAESLLNSRDVGSPYKVRTRNGFLKRRRRFRRSSL